MRQAFLALAFLSLGANGAPAQQTTKAPTTKEAGAAPTQAGQKQVFLGVGVEALPPALASQMAGAVPKGEGLLVELVTRGSPAEKAGLQPNDILLSYGGQKLRSPEQLVKLVRADKPGHAVPLGFVRNGKSATATATLAARPSPIGQDEGRVFRFRPDERLREMFEEYEARDGKSWDSLESLKLTRVNPKHWRAEIDYRTSAGKKEHKAFEGTREEIRKAVRAEKEMPANERRHLLRALSLHEPAFEFHFPRAGGFGPAYWEEP